MVCCCNYLPAISHHEHPSLNLTVASITLLNLDVPLHLVAYLLAAGRIYPPIYIITSKSGWEIRSFEYLVIFIFPIMFSFDVW